MNYNRKQIGGFLNLNESFARTFGSNNKMTNLNESQNLHLQIKDKISLDVWYYIDDLKDNGDKTKTGKIEVRCKAIDLHFGATVKNADNEDIATRICELIFDKHYLLAKIANLTDYNNKNTNVYKKFYEKVLYNINNYNPETDSGELGTTLYFIVD
jgi:hypothetical protein